MKRKETVANIPLHELLPLLPFSLCPKVMAAFENINNVNTSKAMLTFLLQSEADVSNFLNAAKGWMQVLVPLRQEVLQKTHKALEQQCGKVRTLMITEEGLDHDAFYALCSQLNMKKLKEKGERRHFYPPPRPAN